ncbi:Uncharacterized protein dnm_040020 [Desulfonema magnum]|uniref:Uncharacterized protein n=1 Tax=Desulfonema magnum TaxID=45655 RepID=A0A975BMM0_9BACT|nr:Uncharacterized protein dnm_040020 [Desulfonema magnum]
MYVLHTISVWSYAKCIRIFDRVLTYSSGYQYKIILIYMDIG